ncbi:MAG: cysteine desulfurase [Gammaproteobacteria bacterium]|nr:cysteine desulfurase family protein [Gemmatimonadota bacterium]MYA67756.1 cysteine desulfurase [Gammaproteobacteria bacterium]MYH47496.1 cysteine desulfurase [Gammaproteobacteria bacterium]MYL12321.1 cysteine desulfurase [Gammaproteobacteria bacterium]
MKRPPVYLDYQATTPLDPHVRETMLPFLHEQFGNPHSKDHAFGWQAALAIRDARAKVSSLINADDDEIIFTSGATEACNLAIVGVAKEVGPAKRNRIVTVETEHPAVLKTVMDLESEGFEPVLMPVDSDGLLDLAICDEAINERTLLVSVMAANNEIGVLQPLKEIAARCRTVGAIFHSDAAQASGRLPIDVDSWGVDLMSLSAHKFYGPKGIGALYVRSGVPIRSILQGGGQERGLRSGTLAPALVAGFGVASELAWERQQQDSELFARLTGLLLDCLRRFQPDLHLFGHPTRRLPGSLNIGFPGVPAEQIIRNLADSVAVSSGAACSSAASEPSRVLLALGVDAETAATGIRISMGRFTTEAEIKIVAEAFKNVVSQFRPESQRRAAG